jgi:hypothetical protein
MIDLRTTTVIGIPEDYVEMARKASSGQAYLDAVITGEIASEWLRRFKYDRQRPIYAQDVNNYKVAMENGDMGICEPIIIGIVGDDVNILNGYHRLTALEQWGQRYRFSFTIRVFPSFEALHQEYARIDRGRRRTDRELIQGLDVFQDSSLFVREQIELLQAIKVIDNGFIDPSQCRNRDRNSNHKSVRWLAETASDWLPYAEQFYACIADCPEKLRRSFGVRSILAVMLVAIRYQPTEAIKFLTNASRNDGLRQGTPEHVFLNQVVTGVEDRKRAERK